MHQFYGQLSCAHKFPIRQQRLVNINNNSTFTTRSLIQNRYGSGKLAFKNHPIDSMFLIFKP